MTGENLAPRSRSVIAGQRSGADSRAASALSLPTTIFHGVTNRGLSTRDGHGKLSASVGSRSEESIARRPRTVLARASRPPTFL